MIRLEQVGKIYNPGEHQVQALVGIDLRIAAGELVAITGPSGCGKSTLMNILGCMDRPTSGKFFLDGVDASALTTDELAAIRNRKVGFVFQAFNLLPKQDALANALLPLLYRPDSGDRKTRGREVLERVGLGERAHHLPNQLSGGEKQRLAIARALVGGPSIVLADEPTGNLDSVTGQGILELFKKLNDEGQTVVMVTHDRDVANFCRRQVAFKDGRLVHDSFAGRGESA